MRGKSGGFAYKKNPRLVFLRKILSLNQYDQVLERLRGETIIFPVTGVSITMMRRMMLRYRSHRLTGLGPALASRLVSNEFHTARTFFYRLESPTDNETPESFLRRQFPTHTEEDISVLLPLLPGPTGYSSSFTALSPARRQVSASPRPHPPLCLPPASPFLSVSRLLSTIYCSAYLPSWLLPWRAAR